MSCHQHGYPWPSLTTSPYHSSPPAGLQSYILCLHIAAVCRFELVVLLLLGHMWGSIGVHHFMWGSIGVRYTFSTATVAAVVSSYSFTSRRLSLLLAHYAYIYIYIYIYVYILLRTKPEPLICALLLYLTQDWLKSVSYPRHIVISNTTHLKQKFGLPMSSPLSCFIACIYLELLGSARLKYIIPRSSNYFQYIDVILLIYQQELNLIKITD